MFHNQTALTITFVFVAVAVILAIESAPAGAMGPSGKPVVSQDGVGPIRVGEALPSRFRDRRLLTAGYVATYYSDGQPLEGFKFADPPVTAYVHGAFHEWGMTHVSPKGSTSPPSAIRDRTIQAVLAGQLRVKMIVVESPDLKTDRGIGIGASKEEFQRAYPKLQIESIPPLWEDPTVLAQDGRLVFFFASAVEQPQKQGAPTAIAKTNVVRMVIYELDPVP
jgi:hypothetical protein